jgi:hypothetical protein
MRVGYLFLAASVAVFASCTGVSASSAAVQNAMANRDLVLPADAIVDSHDKRFLRIPDEDTDNSDSDETEEDETDEDSDDSEERALPTLDKSLSEKISTSTANAAKKFTKSKSSSELIGMTAKKEDALLNKFEKHVWAKNKESFKKIDEELKVTPDVMATRLKIAQKVEEMKPALLRQDPDYLLWIYYSRYWKSVHPTN